MRRTLVAAVAAVILFASPGGASTFVALTDAELVGGAEAIIQGRVVSQETLRTPDGRLIVTEAVVRVREVLAGEAAEFVTVRTVGGRLGNLRIEAPGFPQFNAGERVILFLEPEPEGEQKRVRGYQQGHFEVVRRLDGVQMVVPRIEEGTRLVTRDGRVLPEPQSTRLSAFKRTVRRLAGDNQPPQQ